MPRGLYNPALGQDTGVAVRAIHNRPKWNSEHPSLADNFGSANSLLYSYRDFELADTSSCPAPTATRPGRSSTTGCSRRTTRRSSSTRAGRVRAQRGGPRRGPPAAAAQHRRGAHQLADERHPEHRQARSGLHRRALDAASFQALKAVVTAGQVQAREHRGTSPASRRPRSRKAAKLLGQPEEDVDPLREGRHLVGHPERSRDEHVRQPGPAARQPREPGPRVRPPGRPPERLHVRLRLAAPAGRRPAAATCGRSSPRGRSTS